MTTFRLAHLSDTHLPPPPPASMASLMGKRLLSRVAWARHKHRNHRPEVLARLILDVRERAPDHIAITGDLTNFATPEEFDAARAWLEDLGPADRVTVSPGNHDALVGQGEAFERFAPWRPWLGDVDAEAFPAVRVRGPLALINLCSAVPTALHLAQGELGEAQLGRLEALLPTLSHLRRVLILHHPPSSGVVSGRKALRDRQALVAVIERHGCDLVLHGHGHTAPVTALAGPDGARIPVLGVPSASALGLRHDLPARWHELALEAARGPIRVTARGLAPGGEIEDLGSYILPPS